MSDRERTFQPATQSLPTGYVVYASLDLAKHARLAVALNLAAVVLFIIFGWIFAYLLALINPQPLMIGGRNESVIAIILAVIGVYALTITLHELVHGAGFWLATGAAPRFGFKWAYAYAAAPDWFVTRNSYLGIGLAPFLVLSLAGLGLASWFSSTGLFLLWLALTANAAGSLGDLLVVGWLFFQPAEILVQDRGEGFAAFRMESSI